MLICLALSLSLSLPLTYHRMHMKCLNSTGVSILRWTYLLEKHAHMWVHVIQLNTQCMCVLFYLGSLNIGDVLSVPIRGKCPICAFKPQYQRVCVDDE
jgi:hypothetical protein